VESALSEKISACGVIALSVLAVGRLAIGQGLAVFSGCDRYITIKGLLSRTWTSDFAIWTLCFRSRGGNTTKVREAIGHAIARRS